MKQTKTLLLRTSAIVCALMILCGVASNAQSDLSKRKIIAFGGGGPAGGVPDTKWFRDRIAEMESALPVDGILISANPTVDGKYVYFADAWFGSRAFNRNDFVQQIAELNAARTNRFTDNYLRLDVLPGDVNWFDDAGWNTMLSNGALAATIAGEGRLKGIFLDTEQYNPKVRPFDYGYQKGRSDRPFEEHADMAFQRGRQLGEAFAKSYPHMTLLLTYATSSVAREIGAEGQLPLTASSSSLLPAFVDGLLATDRLTVVDAYERSYGFKSHAQYKLGRERIKLYGKRLSRNPTRYDRLQAGFGVWLAYGMRRGEFETTGFWGNHFTPEELEHALSYALELSDGTIWIYMGGLRVFSGDALPAEYREAILKAKLPHGPDWLPRDDTSPSRPRKSDPPHRLVFEAEDMSPTLVEGKEGLTLLDSTIGRQTWGQHKKMVVVLSGLYTTGAVRFTFPEAMPDGVYRLRVRVATPPNQNDSRIRWRDVVEGGKVTALEGPGEGWTTIQFGEEEKGTKLGYAEYTWLELFGPAQPFRENNVGWKRFEGVGPGDYTIEINDNDPATYNMVWVDQFELVRRWQPEEMKIIAFGGLPGCPSGGVPDPRYLQAHFDELEALPFDGVVFNISNRVGYFADVALSRKPYTYADIEPDVKLMKSMPFRQITDNYLRLDTTSIDYDWFDDAAWANAVEGFRIVARAAYKSGAVGIMMDTEQYTNQSFNYMLQARRAETSFAEYVAEVRQRGREAMTVMRAEFPGLRLMVTFGPSIAYKAAARAPLYVTGAGLLPAFFDGLLEAAEGCVIIDGYEGAYGYHRAAQFIRARRLIRDETVNISAARSAYRERLRVGFGVWPAGAEKLLAENYAANAFTPKELEHAICFALEQSDGTIWIYGGGTNWFVAPKDYLDAIKSGRQPHDYSFEPLKRPGSDAPKGYIISAKGRNDTADEIVFAALRNRCTEVYNFPKRWRFKLDPEDVGVKEKWFASDLDETTWREIEISEWWEPQLKRIYLGFAWYRFTFNAPAEWKGKNLLLAFGAVDEQAWVYLNGKLAGKQAYGPEGWNTPFEIDVSGKLKLGARNVLAVRVHNSAGVGGIWKSVKIFQKPQR